MPGFEPAPGLTRVAKAAAGMAAANWLGLRLSTRRDSATSDVTTGLLDTGFTTGKAVNGSIRACRRCFMPVARPPVLVAGRQASTAPRP